MPLTIRSLAHSLLVAGGCSLSAVAVAGPPLTMPATLSVPDTAAQAKLEGMKVEIALLGDPVAAAQAIEVRVVNDTVVLQGTVQDEAARRRVLEIARQTCYVPVGDSMSTIARTTGQAARTTAPLHQSARDALVRQLGSKADRFQLTTGDDGSVTVKGEVASAEDKLQVSRLLRAVPGCTRINNSLTIRTQTQAGHAITVVSSDGQTVVCTPLHVRERETPLVATTSIERAAARDFQQPAAQPVASQTLPSGLPVSRTINVTTVKDGKEVTRPVMYVVPTTAGYATTQPMLTAPMSAGAPCNCETVPFQEGVVMTDGHETGHPKPFLSKLFAWKNARVQRTAPAGHTVAVSAPVMVSSQPAVVPPSPPVYTAPAPKVPVMPPPQPAAPELNPVPATLPRDNTVGDALPPLESRGAVPQVTKLKPVEHKPADPKPELPPVPTEVAAAPEPVPAAAPPVVPQAETWPAAHDVRPARPLTATQTYQSRPLAGLASRSMPRPVPAAVVAPTPTPMPALTNPVAPPDVQPATVAPVAQQPVTPLAARVEPTLQHQQQQTPPTLPPMRSTSRDLIQKVKAHCGGMVTDVRIELAKDGKILVHVHAGPRAEGQVVAKLLEIPELAASNVSLRLHLTQ